MTLKSESSENPIDKLPPILKKDLGRDLCTCNQVRKIDIIKAILSGATTVSAVQKETYATMGSGCCEQQVERLIECLCNDE